jgi:tetratricopeptide (TPR) repeat protein
MKKLLSVLIFICLLYPCFSSDIEEKLSKKALQAQAYFNLGNDKYDAGSYAESVLLFNKAIELDAKFVEKFMPSLLSKAYNLRGNAKRALGRYKGALEDYDKSLKISPKCVWVYYNRGYTNIAAGYYEDAIKDYSKIIKLRPKEDFAYYNRGYAKAKNKQYKEAIKDYNTAIRLDQVYAQAYCKRGDALFHLKRYKAASKSYYAAIDIDAKNPQPKLGLQRIKDKKAYEANKDIRLSLKEENIDLISNKVLLCYNLGIIKRKILKKHESNINYAKLYYAKEKPKHRIMTKAERVQKIVDDYIKTLEADYKNARTYNKMGNSKFKSGDYKEAIKDYSKAIKLAPMIIDGYDNRANARLKLGQYKEATKDFKKAKQLEELQNDLKK